MAGSYNTIAAEVLGDFFKSLGKKGLNLSKKMANNVLKFLEELWKMQSTLVLLLHLEALKQFYYHYKR